LIKVTRPRSNRARTSAAGTIFSLPWLLGLVVFSAGPILASLYFSFTNQGAFGPAAWVGFNNYRELLRDPVFHQAVWNTLYLTGIGVPVSIGLALLIALALNFPIHGQPVYRAVAYLPAIVPVITISYVWEWILNDQGGYLNKLLGLVDLPQPAWLSDPSWIKPGLLLLILWTVGASAIIYLAGLRQVSQSLYEAAAVDGCGAWRRFRYVTWPVLSPVTLFLVIVGCISFLQLFTQPYILAQGTVASAGAPA